jgi:hypothetical protein
MKVHLGGPLMSLWLLSPFCIHPTAFKAELLTINSHLKERGNIGHLYFCWLIMLDMFFRQISWPFCDCQKCPFLHSWIGGGCTLSITLLYSLFRVFCTPLAFEHDSSPTVEPQWRGALTGCWTLVSGFITPCPMTLNLAET